MVDYAHELNLQRECQAERSITPADEAWIEAEVRRLSSARTAAVDPFAGLQPSQYVEIRKALGVPSVVLQAFRDRVVNVVSVPLPFLGRLAGQLRTGHAELVRFLAGPPRLPPNLAFKADAAPRAPADKMSFASVLGQAGVSADQVAALLAEDD
ncbi:hypothetical protein [uncultured Enterovirga sp.]|uniref:hypothetical protein n=1 Tax=uncultured Enterovirga sp. TaxID=2026352 RepID=UPI0035CB8F88